MFGGLGVNVCRLLSNAYDYDQVVQAQRCPGYLDLELSFKSV